VLEIVIEPQALFGQEPRGFFIRFGIRQVNLVVCGVEIPAQDDLLTGGMQAVADIEQLGVKAKLEIHPVLAALPIGEIDMYSREARVRCRSPGPPHRTRELQGLFQLPGRLP